MSNELSLPASSFGELKKIIRGYSHLGDKATLDDLAHLVGMNRTSVSANNKFLSQIGLIEGGRVKKATPHGTKLGRALEHDQIHDVELAWQEAIKSNERLSGLVTTVRIKAGMTPEELCGHILYVSGQSNNKANRTGARTIVDLLVESGLLEEKDGKLQVASPTESQPGADQPVTDGPDESTEVLSEHGIPKAAHTSPTNPLGGSTNPTIAINIQLQLPETENAEVYEKLFSALRKHLIDHEQDG